MDEKENLGCCSSCHDCSGCGHDDENDITETGVITFTDDEGKDVDFEILDVIPFEGKEYLVVLPCSDDEDSEDEESIGVLILEIKEEDGEEVYDTVTDDDIAEKVFEEFKKINSEE